MLSTTMSRYLGVYFTPSIRTGEMLGDRQVLRWPWGDVFTWLQGSFPGKAIVLQGMKDAPELLTGDLLSARCMMMIRQSLQTQPNENRSFMKRRLHGGIPCDVEGRDWTCTPLRRKGRGCSTKKPVEQ